MIEKSYTINLAPAEKKVEINVCQYDTDFQILIYLSKESPNFTIDEIDFNAESGTTVELRGTKPNGESYTHECVISGNMVILQGDSNLTNVAGKGVYELCFTHNGKWLSTDNFIIKVEPSPAERS